MRQLIVFSLFASVLSSACGGKSSGGKNETQNDAPLVQTPLTSPSAESSPMGSISINFDAKVNGQELKCSDNSAAMKAEGQIFTDVRFFLSNLVLINDEGQEIKLNLDSVTDSKNLQFTDSQSNTVALLNYLEPSCAKSDATAVLKNSLAGSLPFGHYKALKFQVGLPYIAAQKELVKIPAALAPSDMAWMWEHYPAEIQLEIAGGNIFNKLLDTNTQKSTITLPLDITHAANEKAPITVQLELSRLFLTTAEAFGQNIEGACRNSTTPMTEDAPNCAQAFKALGFPVLNSKDSAPQSIFSIIP